MKSFRSRRQQIHSYLEVHYHSIFDFISYTAVLGLHSLITQEESFAVESEKIGEAIKKFGLRKPGNCVAMFLLLLMLLLIVCLFVSFCVRYRSR